MYSYILHYGPNPKPTAERFHSCQIPKAVISYVVHYIIIQTLQHDSLHLQADKIQGV